MPSLDLFCAARLHALFCCLLLTRFRITGFSVHEQKLMIKAMWPFIHAGTQRHLAGPVSKTSPDSSLCLTQSCSSGRRRTSLSILRQHSWGKTSCVERSYTRTCKCTTIGRTKADMLVIIQYIVGISLTVIETTP